MYRYTYYQWLSPTPVGCDASLAGNYGLHIQEYFQGDIYYCYEDLGRGFQPWVYYCDYCVDGEPLQYPYVNCPESPLSTCVKIPVYGEFRIAAYDFYSHTRPQVIYRKGSCPVLLDTATSGDSTIGSSTTGSISTTGSTLGESISTGTFQSITTDIGSTIGSEATSTTTTHSGTTVTGTTTDEATTFGSTTTLEGSISTTGVVSITTGDTGVAESTTTGMVDSTTGALSITTGKATTTEIITSTSGSEYTTTGNLDTMICDVGGAFSLHNTL